jgi:hypothetical protein
MEKQEKEDFITQSKINRDFDNKRIEELKQVGFTTKQAHLLVEYFNFASTAYLTYLKK